MPPEPADVGVDNGEVWVGGGAHAVLQLLAWSSSPTFQLLSRHVILRQLRDANDVGELRRHHDVEHLADDRRCIDLVVVLANVRVPSQRRRA